MTATQRQPWGTAAAVSAAGIVVLAAAVRLAASGGDFWLDEIWSWTFARQAASALDVFTRFPHDNNHLLNTLFLYLLGEQRSWVIYRIPAVLAGVGSVILAGLIGCRTSRLAGLTAMVLTGGSFVLVLYGSEARGYGPLVFFALLSFYVADRYVARTGWALAACFALSTALGMLSHLTFLHAYLALLLWTGWRLALRRRSWPSAVANATRLHVAPLLAITALYFGFIRRMQVGGGPPYSVLGVLNSALSLSIGGPESGAAAVLAACGAAAVLLASLVVLARRHPDEAIFFGVVIVLSPALLLLLQRPPALFVRYFLVPMVFFLLLVSGLLARVYSWGAPCKVVYGVALLGFLYGNSVHVTQLFRHGRGGYQAAVQYMADRSLGSVVSIGGDHDFRSAMVVDFYARALPAHKQAVYYDRESWPPGGSEWFLIQRQVRGSAPPPAIVVRGSHYRLMQDYPSSALSGWHWYVYHNTAYPL